MKRAKDMDKEQYATARREIARETRKDEPQTADKVPSPARAMTRAEYAAAKKQATK